jgi:alcohol dehydrogenase class IV
MVSKYNQLAPVIFGAGAIEGVGTIIKELGCSKALCVYDSGVKGAGLSVKVEDSLRAAGIPFAVFDKVTSEPPCELIDEGGAFAHENGIDCILGIGGGSSMDAAKAIGILMGAPAPIAQYLTLPPRR